MMLRGGMLHSQDTGVSAMPDRTDRSAWIARGKEYLLCWPELQADRRVLM